MLKWPELQVIVFKIVTSGALGRGRVGWAMHSRLGVPRSALGTRGTDISEPATTSHLGVFVGVFVGSITRCRITSVLLFVFETSLLLNVNGKRVLVIAFTITSSDNLLLVPAVPVQRKRCTRTPVRGGTRVLGIRVIGRLG